MYLLYHTIYSFTSKTIIFFYIVKCKREFRQYTAKILFYSSRLPNLDSDTITDNAPVLKLRTSRNGYSHIDHLETICLRNQCRTSHPNIRRSYLVHVGIKRQNLVDEFPLRHDNSSLRIHASYL